MSKVFIGMIAYNGERFIVKAIESLLAQSHTDLTVFISDDASNDTTQQICEHYARNDSRIQYYRQKQNIGMINNFNFVIQRANTPYFMWASQDDIWEKDFIRICIDNLEKNHDIGLSFTSVVNIDLQDRIVREFPTLPLLSGKANFWTVFHHLKDPEIMGKCLLLYSVFRINICRKILEYSPLRNVWGFDYIFSLAAISHFGVIIDSRPFFKKRIGGISDNKALLYRKDNPVEMIIIKNPKNNMFPVGGGHFTQYLTGNLQAVQGTYYKPLVFIVLIIRSFRAWILFLKNRNYRKIRQIWK